MWKKILAISLVLTMVLSLMACVQLPPSQEIVAGVIESLPDIKTYRFKVDVTIGVTAEAEAFEMTMVTDSIGVLDLEDGKLRVGTTMSVVMPGEDETEMEVETYLIDDMIYMGGEVPGIGTMWVKSEMPEGIWEQVNQVEPQIELLEAAQVEVIGSERVGGVDCYVLEITPDMEQVWQLVIQQAEMVGEMPAFSEEMFRSFSVKQWVEKDTYFLRKANIDVAMELTPETMGLSEEEGVMTMDIVMDLLVYDYNQSVSIELPPEAEDAIEVSL
jgi:hypothetical protein